MGRKRRGGESPSAAPSPLSRSPEIYIPDSWSEAASSIAHRSPTSAPPIAFICGPKNSGKTTFSRLLVNTLLQRYKNVGYLDTDVGQPEFTPPGCLSLHVLREQTTDLTILYLKTPVRCIFFGDVSSKRDPKVFLDGIFSLYDYFVKEYLSDDTKNPKKSILPLVINTAGWVKGAGYLLLVEMLRYIAPTHVVQIRISAESKNLPTGLFWLDEGEHASVELVEIHAARVDSLNRSKSLSPLLSIFQNLEGKEEKRPNMIRAMRLGGTILQRLCKRTAAQSLWNNCAIRLNHTGTCLSVEAQAKLLDLISLMRKEVEAPKLCSNSNDELQRVTNEDLISLLDIFETVLDDKRYQHQHHEEKVALCQKSNETRKTCHREVTSRQTVGEGGHDMKFKRWKRRVEVTEAAVRRLRSPFLSEDLLFGTDSQSDKVVDGLNTVDSTSEIESRKHRKKLENYLKNEPSIKFYSDHLDILGDKKVAKFNKVLKTDDILGCVLYRIYQLTVVELLRRERDYMIFLLKNFDHIKYSSNWIFYNDEEVIDHVNCVYGGNLDSNYLKRGVLLHLMRIPFENLSKPLPKALKAEMLLDIVKRYLSINAKIPKLLPSLSNDEMLRQIRRLVLRRNHTLSILEFRELLNAKSVSVASAG